ncbi:MAG: hypothetical protein K0R39_1993, partial [Symbiobacteriaceae bacterium]|nr:hypothetical protein [Symbiobacteriaceae bacterium]
MKGKRLPAGPQPFRRWLAALTAVLIVQAMGVPASAAKVQPTVPSTTEETVELIVKRNPDAAPVQGRANRMSGAALTSATQATDEGLLLVSVPASKADAELARLQADPTVLYAEPNYRLYAAAVPNDPRWSDQWALTAIEAATGWDRAQVYLNDNSVAASQVVVAVVDTGVDATHPDLASRTVEGYNALTEEVGNAAAADDHLQGGHGTKVAGIIAAETNNAIGIAGVAGTFPVKIMPVKAMDAAGTGTTLSVSNAIRWAADHGANIINLSLGARLPDYPRTLADAVSYAQNQGALVVAASGNHGQYSYDNYFPAALPGVIAVAAVGTDHKKPTWSNIGQVNAPGVDLLTTARGGGYDRLTGTSAAAPVAAGMAAVLWSFRPEMTPAQVTQSLVEGRTADNVLSLADAVYGAGVRPYDEVELLRPDYRAHISGVVTLEAGVTNPARVVKTEFLYRPSDGDVMTLIQSVPGGASSDPNASLSNRFTASWDTTNLPNGPYEVQVKVYTVDQTTCNDWGYYLVANDPETGLEVTVLRPDGEPASGALVSLYHPTQWDEEGTGVYYDRVTQEQADLNGRLTLPNTEAYDGNDYLLVAEGSGPDFLYWKLVRTPAAVTMDATGTLPVTITALDIAGQALGGAALAFELPGTSVLAAEEQEDVAYSAMPVRLDATGSATVHVTPGSYNLRVTAPDQGYYLVQRNVLLRADSPSYTFRPTADALATIVGRPDPGISEMLLTVRDNETWEEVLADQPGTGTYRLSPGTYTVQWQNTVADTTHHLSTSDITLLYDLAKSDLALTAGQHLEIQTGGEPVVTLTPPNGPTPKGQNARFEVSLTDRYGNGITSLRAQVGANHTTLKPGLQITDAAGAPQSGTVEAYSDWRPGIWNLYYNVPTALAAGTYGAKAYFYAGPLTAAADGYVYSAAQSFAVGPTGPSTDPLINLTLKDRIGDPLNYAEVTLYFKRAGEWLQVDSGSTNSFGELTLDAYIYSDEPTLLLLSIAGSSPDPAVPDSNEASLFLIEQVPSGVLPMDLTIDLSAKTFERLRLQTLTPNNDPLYWVMYGLYQHMPDGTLVGYMPESYIPSAVEPDPYTIDELWLLTGTHYLITAAARDENSDTLFATREVQVPAGLPADRLLVLGGASNLAQLTVTTPARSEGYGEPALFLYPAAGGVSPLLYPGGNVYATPGTYTAEVRLLKAHYDGRWAYWLQRTVTLGTAAPTALTFDTNFTMSLTVNAEQFMPGDRVQTTHTITDGGGNRLVAVAGDFSGEYYAQNHDEVAPFLTIRDPNGNEVYRHKQATLDLGYNYYDQMPGAIPLDGTFAGDAWTIPADAPSGEYTVTLELSVGPTPMLVSAPVTFTVGGVPAAPYLNSITSPASLTSVNVTGTGALGTTVALSYTLNGGAGVLAGTATVSAAGTFSIIVNLPEEGTYSFTATASNDTGPSQASQPVTLVVDRTPPGAPVNLTWTSPDDTHIRLDWEAPADADVALYAILRDGTEIDTVDAAGVLQYQDGGLAGETDYAYSLVAVDAAGNESSPVTADARTVASRDTTPPEAPDGLTATAGAGGTVELTWNAATDNVEVAGYRIYRKVGDGAEAQVDEVTADTLTWLDQGLEAETAYTYTVTAIDAATDGPNESEHSTAASATTPAISIGSAILRAERNRGLAIIAGATLTLTMTGEPHRTGSATILYENGGQQTATFALTAGATQPGVYTGTFTLPDGAAAVTSLTASLRDGAGHELTRAVAGLPADVTGALEVTLEPTAGLGLAAMLTYLEGGRLTLISPTTRMGGTVLLTPGQSVCNLTGLSPGTDYTVTVTAPDGQTVASGAATVLAGRIGSLTLTITPRASLSLQVVESGSGQALAGLPVIIDTPAREPMAMRTNSSGRISSLSGFAMGESVTVTVTPPMPYADLPPQTYVLAAGGNEQSVSVSRLAIATVSGVVRSQDGSPVAGVVVTGSQTIRGQQTAGTSAPTHVDGAYSLPLYVGDADLTAGSSSGRITSPGPTAITVTADGPNQHDLTVEDLRPVTVTVDLYTKYLGDAEEIGPMPMMDWRNAVHYHLQVRTARTWQSGWAYPVVIEAGPGESVEVCVDGYESGLPAACQTVTVTPQRTAHAEIHLVQQGGRVTGAVQDASGQPFSDWTGVINVGSGLTTQLGSIRLSPAGAFQGRAGNGVSANPSTISPGAAVTFRAAYCNSRPEAVTDAALTFTLPAGTTLVPNSVTWNGAPAAAADQGGGQFTVTLGTIPAAAETGACGSVTWTARIGAAYPAPALFSHAQISSSAGQAESLGGAVVRVVALSMEGPRTVPTRELRLTGRAPVGSTVAVRDGEALLGTVTASAGGLWVMDLLLTGTDGVPLWHQLSAEARDGADAVLSQAGHRVRYDPTVPHLQSITLSGMYYGEPTRTITFDTTDGIPRFPYVYIPGQQLIFTLAFHNPDRVHNVRLGIESDGTSVYAQRLADGTYVATMQAGWQLGDVWVDFDTLPASYVAPAAPPTEAELANLLGTAWQAATFEPVEPGAQGTTINLGGDANHAVSISYQVDPLPGYAPNAAEAARVAGGGAPAYDYTVTDHDNGGLTLSAVLPRDEAGTGYARFTVLIEPVNDDPADPDDTDWLRTSINDSYGFVNGADEIGRMIGRIGLCRLDPAIWGPLPNQLARLQRIGLAQHAMLGSASHLSSSGGATAVAGVTLWRAAAVMNAFAEGRWYQEFGALRRSLAVHSPCAAQAGGTTVLSPVWILDPSGYVYEGLTDNRIEGVTATAMAKTGADWTIWDAAWFGQENPLQTDAEGKYGWDVPPGNWKVSFQKDGYQPAQSSELTVPPIHTDVNVGLVSLAPPAVASITPAADWTWVDVTFSKPMRVDSLAAGAIWAVDSEGHEITGTVTARNPAAAPDATQLFWTARFTPNPAFEGGATYTLKVSQMVLSYASVPMTADHSVSVVAGADVTPPGPVTSITVTPGNQALTLAWTNPGSGDLAKIRIHGPAGVAEVNAPTATATLGTGLINGVTYTLRITTVDALGNESAGVTITGTPADRTAPAQVTGARVEPVGANLVLLWTDPADPDFAKVQVTWTAPGVNDTADVLKGTQNLTLAGLTSSASSYTVRLRSLDTAGNQSAAVIIDRQPPAPPVDPWIPPTQPPVDPEPEPEPEPEP